MDVAAVSRNWVALANVCAAPNNPLCIVSGLSELYQVSFLRDPSGSKSFLFSLLRLLVPGK